MKWKFMFKFKNNILTLGASDVYIFNNLLRKKAWMSGCVSSCLCVTRVFYGMQSAFVYVGVYSSFTCVREYLCERGGGASAFVLECCVFLFVVLAMLGVLESFHLIGICSDKGTGDRQTLQVKKRQSLPLPLHAPPLL